MAFQTYTKRGKNYLLLPLGKTAVEVLEMCAEDVKAGLWICGELIAEAQLNGREKPPGCAIGLAAINSGSASIQVMVDGYTESLCHYPHAVPRSWSAAGKAALKFLAMIALDAKREEFEDDSDRWQFYEDTILNASRKAPASILKRLRTTNVGITLRMADDIIVNYNDETHLDPEAAHGWFMAALALAKQDGVDRQAVSA